MSDERRQIAAPLIPAPRIYVVGALTVLVLGLNWPIMAWGVATFPPLWLTSLRLLGAAALLGGVLAVLGRLKLPSRTDYPVVASVAAVRLGLVYSLAFLALLHVPPGRSSVLIHTSGLWAGPIAARFLRERLGVAKVGGLSLGVAGILFLMEPWNLGTDNTAPLGYVMLLGAALASAVGAVHVRAHRWHATPLLLMPWQLFGAGLLTAVAALLVHGRPAIEWTPGSMAILAYQIIFASGIGLWGTLSISRSLPAVSTGVVLMVVPVVGVISSVLLVGEQISPAAAAGIVLVLAGVSANLALDHRGTGARRSLTPT